MANQNDNQEIVELEEINAELTQSLTLCRKMLFDYRSKLAANGNAPGTPDASEANCDETRSRSQEGSDRLSN